MSGLWVDTDYGFDDLWALLLLKHFRIEIAGLSLVAGNSPLPQVVANALGARRAYALNGPVYAGAKAPLTRRPETAAQILGPKGMPSRGLSLPDPDGSISPTGAIPVLTAWLNTATAHEPREVLALGPLTNIANLITQSPETAAKITRLIWMGGSAGPGNHSPMAEFNALADPEAASIVSKAGIAMDVVDLMLCRQVSFGPADMPCADQLTTDLLGGYLDIGLSRGRSTMAIYDPVAALVAIQPQLFQFEQVGMFVSVLQDETYGATRFSSARDTKIRLATGVMTDISKICLNTLAKDGFNGR